MEEGRSRGDGNRWALDFCRSFHQADLLLVTEIYAASESPITGITGRGLAEGIKKHGHRDVRFVEDLESIPDILAEELRAGDLVLTLGAGNVTKISDQVAEMIRERDE